MKMRAIICAIVAMCCTSASLAAPIFYEATDLTDTTTGEDLWRYDYYIANTTGIEIDAFLIYFDFDAYDFNLVTGLFGDEVDPDDYSFGSQWDGIVAPDDPFLGNADGFLEIYQLAGPTGVISQTNALAEIAASVTFIWEGIGDPGSQFFEFFSASDPFGDPAGEGFTQPPPSVSVPEPGTSMLLGTGLLLLLRNRRRQLRH